MSHQEHPECVSVLPSPVLLYHPLSLQVKRWACSLPSHSKASLESVQQRVSSITAHKSTDTFTLQSLSQWNLIMPVIYINIINMMVTLQFASSMKVNAKSSSCFIIFTDFESFWRQTRNYIWHSITFFNIFIEIFLGCKSELYDSENETKIWLWCCVSWIIIPSHRCILVVFIKVFCKEALYVVHSQINLIYLTLGLNAVSH